MYPIMMQFFLRRLPILLRQAWFSLTFAVNVHLDLGDEIHGQADADRVLAQGAQRLHVQLLALQGIAGLFLDGVDHILGSDRTVQLAGLACPGPKGDLDFRQRLGDRPHFLVDDGALL